MAQRETPEGGAIRVERRGAVVVLTIDRPAVRNALDDAGWLELRDQLRLMSEDPAVRVVVVTGSGDRAFCAGMDLRQVREGGSGRWAPDDLPTPLQAQREVERATKPILAAVNGDAVGAGGQLALACHLQIAARTARIGFPELRYGIVPAAAGLLPPLVGRSRALGLVLLGDLLGAAEAHAMGLLTYLMEPDQVLPEALRIADTLAERDPAAVAGILQLAASSRTLSPEQLLAATAAYHGAAHAPAAAPPPVARKEASP